MIALLDKTTVALLDFIDHLSFLLPSLLPQVHFSPIVVASYST